MTDESLAWWKLPERRYGNGVSFVKRKVWLRRSAASAGQGFIGIHSHVERLVVPLPRDLISPSSNSHKAWKVLFSGLCCPLKMLNRDGFLIRISASSGGGQRRAHSHLVEEAHRPARVFASEHGLITLCMSPPQLKPNDLTSSDSSMGRLLVVMLVWLSRHAHAVALPSNLTCG